MFDQFKSSDFELVLRRLWHAKLVNEALAVENPKVAAAYLAVRTALIETVRSVHVTYEDATPHLRSIATFMQHFRTVASLNYDLVTYWAAMIAKNDFGHAIKDGFIHEGGTSFTLNWKRLRERIRGRETTMLFYPHGNLVLTRLDKDEERKIVSRGDGDLLHTILETWTEEKGVPIFVCEGTSEQKKHAVQTSSYLGRVYREVFNEPLLSLAIYGWGIGGQEQHILDRIEAARPARVAVSVLGRDQTYADHAYQRFSAIGVRDIRFFDAASAGAWNKRANNIRLFCLVGDDGQPVGIHCVGSAGHEGMAFDLFSSESAAADQARDDELEFEMATNIRGISGRDLLALLSVADALYLDDNDIPLTFAGQLLLETNEVMDAVTALDTLESSKDA